MPPQHSAATAQHSTAQHNAAHRSAAQHSAPSRSCRPPCSLGPAACPEMEVEEGPTCQGRPLNRAAASDAGPSGMPCGRCVPAAGVFLRQVCRNRRASFGLIVRQQSSSRAAGAKKRLISRPPAPRFGFRHGSCKTIPPAHLLTQATPKSSLHLPTCASLRSEMCRLLSASTTAPLCTRL